MVFLLGEMIVSCLFGVQIATTTTFPSFNFALPIVSLVPVRAPFSRD